MGRNTKTSALTAGKKFRTADNSKRKEDMNSEKQGLKKKKKKRFIPIKVKQENKSETLNKAFADFKPPKGTVSSNWLAFKTSGLYEETKKEPVESKFKGKKRHPWRKSQEKTSDLSAPEDVKAPQIPNADLPQDMTIEDTLIADLTPKSDAEKKELTHCIAMDCEMVGVGDGKENILARISLVNQHGECIYDKFVKPKEEVIDYRTFVSGVRPSDLKKGEDFEVVQKEVASILSGRILVGHAIHNDLKVLLLNHPPRMIRDTSRFKPFRNINQGRLPGLKKLAAEVLGVTIQTGEHSSVEDAKATMQLYNLYQKEWEDHRLQRKLLRKKKSIEAAVGSSRVMASRKSQKLSRPKKNPDMDEFVAF